MLLSGCYFIFIKSTGLFDIGNYALNWNNVKKTEFLYLLNYRIHSLYLDWSHGCVRIHFCRHIFWLLWNSHRKQLHGSYGKLSLIKFPTHFSNYNNAFVLLQFSIMLIATILVETGIGVFIAIKKNDIEDAAIRELKKFSGNFHENEKIWDFWQCQVKMIKTLLSFLNQNGFHCDIYWSFLPLQFECCGLNGPDDWNKINITATFPKSCCGFSPEPQTDCTRAKSSFYDVGCEVKFREMYNYLFKNVIVIAILAVFYIIQVWFLSLNVPIWISFYIILIFGSFPDCKRCVLMLILLQIDGLFENIYASLGLSITGFLFYHIILYWISRNTN